MVQVVVSMQAIDDPLAMEDVLGTASLLYSGCKNGEPSCSDRQS